MDNAEPAGGGRVGGGEADVQPGIPETDHGAEAVFSVTGGAGAPEQERREAEVRGGGTVGEGDGGAEGGPRGAGSISKTDDV